MCVKLGNEIAQNWIFWKLAEWRILQLNELPLAQDPWRETEPQEQCQSQEGIIWVGSFIFQPQVLKSQRGVKPAVQAVSHGNVTMHVHV